MYLSGTEQVKLVGLQRIFDEVDAVAFVCPCFRKELQFVEIVPVRSLKIQGRTVFDPFDDKEVRFIQVMYGILSKNISLCFIAKIAF